LLDALRAQSIQVSGHRIFPRPASQAAALGHASTLAKH
jgi:hypothetical protein